MNHTTFHKDSPQHLWNVSCFMSIRLGENYCIPDGWNNKHWHSQNYTLWSRQRFHHFNYYAKFYSERLTNSCPTIKWFVLLNYYSYQQCSVYFVYFGTLHYTTLHNTTQHNYTIHKLLIINNVSTHSICVMISTTWSQFNCSSLSIHIPFLTELPWQHLTYCMLFSQHALFTIITTITIHTNRICIIIIIFVIMNVDHCTNPIDHSDDAFYSNHSIDCDYFIDCNWTPYTSHWIISTFCESPHSVYKWHSFVANCLTTVAQAYPFPTQHCAIDEDGVFRHL